MKREAIRPDYLSKTLAGVLLGLTLGLVCSAIFARLAAGLIPPVRAQLAMWMVTPVWFTVLGSSYFFASGKRAWIALSLANVALVGLLLLVRRM